MNIFFRKDEESASLTNIGENIGNSPSQGGNPAPQPPVPAPDDPVHLESFMDYPVEDDGFLDFPAGDNNSSEENFSAAHHQALLNFDISALQDS
jgi:hypothetical protein